MKKLLILLSVIGMTVSVFAEKGGKGGKDESENESEETANGNGKSSNKNEDPNTPPSPPPNVTNEVDENEAPSDLIKELEDEVKKLQEDKSDLLDDLETATGEIKSLLEERGDLRKTISELEGVLDRGPGSLFRGWVYSTELKWVYISPTIVPYAFSQNDGWMFYEYGTNPRRVYYYRTKKWELLDNESKNER